MSTMSLAEAADIFVETTPAIKELEAQRGTAKQVLLEHFRKTGRHSYKGRIGYSRSLRTVLDQEKVKRELGRRLPKFQKTVSSESVTVLS